MRRWTELLPVGLLLVWGCGADNGSIGAMLSQNHRDGRVLVRQVPPDMESARAGLRAGDEVLSVDGRDVRAMSSQEVHDALTGPVGSTVDLTVLRDGRVLRLRVQRGPLK